jgi:hypothetical protein
VALLIGGFAVLPAGAAVSSLMVLHGFSLHRHFSFFFEYGNLNHITTATAKRRIIS